MGRIGKYIEIHSQNNGSAPFFLCAVRNVLKVKCFNTQPCFNHLFF